MCGILLNLCRASTPACDIKNSIINLRHRGPDKTCSRTETFGDWQLDMIFHRLAIRDTSSYGDQPFYKDEFNIKFDTVPTGKIYAIDGETSVYYKIKQTISDIHTTYVMCNGEIYNYNDIVHTYDLKNKLVGKSDCEVILPLYYLFDHNIQKTYNALKGEFAFIIVDIFGHNKEIDINIYAGRDQFGVRPLFYTIDKDNGISLGSELRGLIHRSSLKYPFPPGHVFNYNIRGMVDNNILTIHQTSYYFRQVYELPLYHNINFSHLDIYTHIRTLLFQAVDRRLISDRPLGCLLSGGLDSSLVAAIASRLLGKQEQTLKTFSIGLAESPDLKYARDVAKYIGSDHTEVILSAGEVLKWYRATIRTTESWDITTNRASAWQFMLAKYISEKTDIKVLLNGDGSDEVCMGYLLFHKAPTPDDARKESEKLVSEIYMYDGLRVDRCLARWGLEARIPFLDVDFVDYYMFISPELRVPQPMTKEELEHTDSHNSKLEKALLRRAFANLNLLPKHILYRKKEAFSDGVSKENNSWYSILQTYIESKMNISGKECRGKIPTENTPEAQYIKNIFDDYYPGCRHVIPHYWMPPEWCGSTNDPSARTLSIY